MRHGEAEPKAASDSERHLTKIGDGTGEKVLSHSLGNGRIGGFVIVTSPILGQEKRRKLPRSSFGLPTVIENPGP